ALPPMTDPSSAVILASSALNDCMTRFIRSAVIRSPGRTSWNSSAMASSPYHWGLMEMHGGRWRQLGKQCMRHSALLLTLTRNGTQCSGPLPVPSPDPGRDLLSAAQLVRSPGPGKYPDGWQ